MTKIIGISGKKQSGKNTVANIINGNVLGRLGMIKGFYIDEAGQLVILTANEKNVDGYGILDVTRKDKEFVEYAQRELWPYIKVYHFADYLKEMAVNLFGLTPQQVYGSDKQKNVKTALLWEDMPENTNNKTGRMTSREFLEHFGTKIVRKIKNDAWVKSSINKIVGEDSGIAIIPDVRFPNEVQAIQDNGGKVIRLTRDVFNSDVDAETALDKDKFDWGQFDLVIDNSEISIDQLSKLVTEHPSISLWSN